MRYQIIYDSKTGNTRKLAEHIYEYLEGETRDIKTVAEFNGTEDADLYFVGFSTNRNSCSMDTADVLELLEEKKIALFGTCGMGNTQEYYEKIRKNIDVWMPEDYEDCGFFMCQGRMNDEIKERISIMSNKMTDEVKCKTWQMYDDGLTHPDEEDLKKLELFVDDAIRNG